jgi:trans-aconitate methyltransferase
VEGLDLSPILLDQARRRLPDVPLHLADMRDFDLPSRFDSITCLSSSIGYMKTLPDLRLAIATMVRHLNAGGVLIIEPWMSPEDDPHHDEPYLTSYEEPGRKAVMLEITTLVGDLWVSQSHYLTATPERIEHFAERVEQGAFTRADNTAAFEAAGLGVTHHPQGILGRGLYIGVKPY